MRFTSLLLTLCIALSLVPARVGFAQSNTEWVVVLNDPRPARLQGWQRSQYTGGNHYKHSLELKRAGQRVANKHDLLVQTEWYIESLKVYCLIAMFRDEELATLDKLRADKNVKWVQPSNSFELLQTPIETKIDPALIDPPELRLPTSLNGKGVVIVLVDSAVDDTHPDIKKNISENINFVGRANNTTIGESHGTAIASIIAADHNSDLGVTGIAPGVELKAYRGCWEAADTSGPDAPNCSTLSLARALDAAASAESDLLNLSLTGPKDELLDQLINQIISSGTQVVTAFDPNRSADQRFPSPSAGILTVQADTQSSTDIFSAPGTKIVASPGGKSNLMQGHSVAAAYATGVLALCAQAEAQLKREVCRPSAVEQFKKNKIHNVGELTSALERALK